MQYFWERHPFSVVPDAWKRDWSASWLVGATAKSLKRTWIFFMDSWSVLLSLNSCHSAVFKPSIVYQCLHIYELMTAWVANGLSMAYAFCAVRIHQHQRFSEFSDKGKLCTKSCGAVPRFWSHFTKCCRPGKFQTVPKPADIGWHGLWGQVSPQAEISAMRALLPSLDDFLQNVQRQEAPLVSVTQWLMKSSIWTRCFGIFRYHPDPNWMLKA